MAVVFAIGGLLPTVLMLLALAGLTGGIWWWYHLGDVLTWMALSAVASVVALVISLVVVGHSAKSTVPRAAWIALTASAIEVGALFVYADLFLP